MVGNGRGKGGNRNAWLPAHYVALKLFSFLFLPGKKVPLPHTRFLSICGGGGSKKPN